MANLGFAPGWQERWVYVSSASGGNEVLLPAILGAESQAAPSPEDAEGGAHLPSASSVREAVAEQFALRPVVSVLPNLVN